MHHVAVTARDGAQVLSCFLHVLNFSPNLVGRLMWAYNLEAGGLDANMSKRSHLNNLGCTQGPLLDTFLSGVPVRCDVAVI